MLHHVTQEDIDRGVQKNCGECPVARRLSRDYGRPVSVTFILGWRFCDEEEGPVVYYKHPPEVLKFIESFDAGLPVSPFTFEDGV